MRLEKDIMEALAELLVQATEERSHYYVASVVRQAIKEIARLREYEWMYKDLSK